MRNPFRSSDDPVIDPRWEEYLDTSEFGARGGSGGAEENPHDRELRELMSAVIRPWQLGEATSRETLLRLRRLADLHL